MPCASSLFSRRSSGGGPPIDTQGLLSSALALGGGSIGPGLLRGRHVAWLGEAAGGASADVFSAAAEALGATVVHLGPGLLKEADTLAAPGTARMLGRLYCAIGCDGLDARALAQLTRWAGVPILDGIASPAHPTRVLGDLLAMCEGSGKPAHELSLCLGERAPAPLTAIWQRASRTLGIRVLARPGGCAAACCDYRLALRLDGAGTTQRVLLGHDGHGGTPRALDAAQREGHCRVVQVLLARTLA